MNQLEIMAVVVSFNGGQKTLRTISALVGQVGHIHIVDNSSEPESVSILKEISRQTNISISWMTENRGVGYALNVGIRRARKLGFRWLLTMDQDSIVDNTMIQIFRDAVINDPSIVCLTPQYYEDHRGAEEDVVQVDYAITSGNLVNMEVFDKVGFYNEDFFIDGIDFDFSLRVRREGWHIYLIKAARMQHELGDKSCTTPLIGRFHTFHTPLRRYYIYRNCLYLISRYAREFPGFVLKTTLSHLLYALTILLLGEQRLRSYISIFLGLLDFLIGKQGPSKHKHFIHRK